MKAEFRQLSNSALEMITPNACFFILKDHGFVALAENIATAGKLTLRIYERLLNLLGNKQI